MGSGLLCGPEDVELGELLKKYIPCAERVKLTMTGSDAVYLAMRLARAYTGRPYFIRFGGSYHGWHDMVAGGQIDPNPQGMPFPIYNDDADPLEDPEITKGRVKSSETESFMLPWNDVERLEEVLAKYGDQVAAIHFEPVFSNHAAVQPKPGWLQKIRELCDQYGIVMSMDEVVSGFRMGLGGAQKFYGVTPDIATFGKAIAGGVPFAAVCGKAKIMDQLADRTVLGPGTFNGWPMGVRAALTTIKILEKDNGAAYKNMFALQKKLTDGLQALAKKHGLRMRLQDVPGLFYTLFGMDPDKTPYMDEDFAEMDFEKIDGFWKGLKQEGVAMTFFCRFHMNIQHTDKDITDTLEKADKVMATL
jgi:glutamate-1-semialdehyde 2,1-aminomutase